MFTNQTYQQINETLHVIKSLLRLKRHYDFVRNVEEVENCYRPRDYRENILDSCNFVKTTPSCNGVVSIFNYLQFYVCTLQWDASAAKGLSSIAWCGSILCLYFLSLYVSGRYFLLPNSIVLANYFNMKNYDFGIVVLGILFTLPFDLTMIFSCVEYNRSDSLLHAQTFGKMFTCLIIGLCLVSHRKIFHLNGAIFMREMLFLTIASIYLYSSVYREMMNENLPPYERKESLIHIHAYVNIVIYMIYVLNIIIFSRKRFGTPTVTTDPDYIPSSSVTIESDTYPELHYNPVDCDINPWQQFVDCVNPWKALVGHSIPIRIIMSPFYVLYASFIPVVHRNRKLNGWCKWIVCCSCMAFPLYFLILQLNSYTIILCGLLGALATLLLTVLTHSQREPTNHELLAFWGLIIGFAIFNIVDLEICCILWQFLNYVKNMENDVIMIVVFPFSYVFVEGIFVLTLMENGYREMALGFVMGTVLFIAFSSLPVMLFSVCFPDTDHIYSLTDNTTTAFYFILITEVVTIFGFSINGYELRPSVSVFFGLVALIFSLFMVLENEDIIHAYGTIHSLTVFVDVLHSQWT